MEATRELKALGVDIFFEKENIHSMSGDGELMLTLLASFAQEESLSVSENCKWRIRQNFLNGIPGTTRMNGYKMKCGEISVIPEEAEIVQMIFKCYLSGMGKKPFPGCSTIWVFPQKTAASGMTVRCSYPAQ